MNVIDARFIDTRNGFYIDITGLSVKPNTKKLDDNMLLGCKSPHFYRFADIFPLVRTTFEGIATWRPNNITPLLTSEYSARALNQNVFKVSFDYLSQEYKFNKDTLEWQKMTTCGELKEAYKSLIDTYEYKFPLYVWEDSCGGKKKRTECCVKVLLGPRKPGEAFWLSQKIAVKW